LKGSALQGSYAITLLKRREEGEAEEEWGELGDGRGGAVWKVYYLKLKDKGKGNERRYQKSLLDFLDSG